MALTMTLSNKPQTRYIWAPRGCFLEIHRVSEGPPVSRQEGQEGAKGAVAGLTSLMVCL